MATCKPARSLAQRARKRRLRHVLVGPGRNTAPRAGPQFGLITTNSLRQTFNRRVIEAHLNDAKAPLHLRFAVPDHPWVDSAAGAAVRIAMSVGAPGQGEGRLLTVTAKKRRASTTRVHVNLEDRRAASMRTCASGPMWRGRCRWPQTVHLSNRACSCLEPASSSRLMRPRNLGLGANLAWITTSATTAMAATSLPSRVA
jgi:hypothetical protein